MVAGVALSVKNAFTNPCTMYLKSGDAVEMINALHNQFIMSSFATPPGKFMVLIKYVMAGKVVPSL